jgi:hypothetical protein
VRGFGSDRFCKSATADQYFLSKKVPVAVALPDTEKSPEILSPALVTVPERLTFNCFTANGGGSLVIALDGAWAQQCRFDSGQNVLGHRA